MESIRLEEPPSCLKFLPYSTTLVAATYELGPQGNENSNADVRRCGNVYTLKKTDCAGVQKWKIDKFQKIVMDGGVFRAELISDTFSTHSGRLLAAMTTGRLSIISHLDDGLNECEAVIETSQRITEDMAINASHNSHTGAIICSGKRGELAVVEVRTDDGQFVKVNGWKAHSLPFSTGPDCEVWSICWLSGLGESICASGAEDAAIKVWDTRVALASAQPSQSNKESHQAGVTCLLPLDDFHLVTGSYDNHIRTFDLRNNLQTPVCRNELGGGVWNIEIVDGHPDHLIAACMYGGCSLLGRASLEIIKRIDDPSNRGQLQYGATTTKIERLMEGGSDGVWIASSYFSNNLITVYEENDPWLKEHN